MFCGVSNENVINLSNVCQIKVLDKPIDHAALSKGLEVEVYFIGGFKVTLKGSEAIAMKAYITDDHFVNVQGCRYLC